MHLLQSPARGVVPFKAHQKGTRACRLGRAARGVRPQAQQHGSRLVAAAAAAEAVTVAQPAPSQHAPHTNGSAAAAAASAPRAGGLVENAPTFQEAIAKLQDYWAAAGCAIWLPHNTEASNKPLRSLQQRSWPWQASQGSFSSRNPVLSHVSPHRTWVQAWNRLGGGPYNAAQPLCAAIMSCSCAAWLLLHLGRRLARAP
jgi:hypothetical protein